MHRRKNLPNCEVNNLLDLDELQQKLNGLSKYQVRIIAATGILPIGLALIIQSPVFNSAVPKFRCSVPLLKEGKSLANLTEEANTRLLFPDGKSCRRFNYILTSCNITQNLSCLQPLVNETVACDNGFEYEKNYYLSTTISEWDLVCDRFTLDSIANSLFFVGTFIGSAFAGPMVDWFGRKIGMLVTCCATVLSGIAVSVAPGFEVYVVFRMLQSAVIMACFLSYYTYINEISYKKIRTAVGIYGMMMTAVGHTTLPVLGMLIRDWRKLNLCISLISTPFIVIFFFIPESPRWLLVKEREKEARAVVEKYAKSNNSELSDDDWEMVVKTENDKIQAGKEAKKYTLKDLFSTTMMRTLTVILSYAWFSAALVFYGLVLNIGQLTGDPHVNSILNGSMEILANSLIFVVVHFFGMKKVTLTSHFMTGALCLASMLFVHFSNGKEGLMQAGRWSAITGKIFATIAYNTIYQYTAEVYPTVVRGTAMSMGSMSARIGSIIMPFTLTLQQTTPWVTQAIFGTLSVTAAILWLSVPDTKRTDMTATIEQAENFYVQNMPFVARFQKIP